MWNGAVFIPLIEEIDTIDPWRFCVLNSAATAWLMKNAVSRLWVNRSRQSPRVTRVDGIQGDDVVVEIFFGPAHRDDRRPGLGDHPGHGGADAAARGAGHHDHAPLETEQIIRH
jgi:hypothetical protein